MWVGALHLWDLCLRVHRVRSGWNYRTLSWCQGIAWCREENYLDQKLESESLSYTPGFQAPLSSGILPPALGPHPLTSRKPGPAGHTHTAQRGSACGFGSQACFLLGRCSALHPQASPQAVPPPGPQSSGGGTKRGLCPPGPSSGWQGACCLSHRASVGTGLSGLPEVGCLHRASGLQRGMESKRKGGGERETDTQTDNISPTLLTSLH